MEAAKIVWKRCRGQALKSCVGRASGVSAVQPVLRVWVFLIGLDMRADRLASCHVAANATVFHKDCFVWLAQSPARSEVLDY